MPLRSSAVVAASRGRDLTRHALAIAACALAAHAAAYGSLVPDDGGHAYFAWYAPLIAALSALSIVGTLLALAIALGSSPSSTPATVVRSILPRCSRDSSLVGRSLGLASGAIVLLAVQESLERSLAGGRFELVSFAPPALAVLLAVVLLAAGAIALVERGVASLADIVLRRNRPMRTLAPRAPRRLRHVRPFVRLRPLAVHGGLRAPPFPA